jgi:serine/threonine protein kinase
MDISDEDPLARIACPVCGAAELVSGRVGGFELEAVVGSGGMGVVYKAYDAGLDRYIALKLLRRDKSINQELVAQLATEASITASINHPHVVRVFTTGTDHGRFYIGMELVDKGTLDDLIKLQGRVAEAQVIQVGIQIAQGLRAALQAGLIHRDVKPGNILFADAHTAKIVDFGLAIFMEDEEQARGEIWGTPYYVAPEKLDHQPEDFRSDMYSLGGTLFHALAGRPPFEAPDASMVALKHLKSQAVSLQAFAPHVSGETAYVINRTLSKDPNDRYQSYDELIEHLEYAAKQIEEKASRPQVQRRVVLEDSRQQKLMGWLTGGIFALILLAGIIGFVFRKQLFRSRSDVGVKPGSSQSGLASTAPSPFPDARAKLVAGDAAGAAELYRQHAAKAKARTIQAVHARYGEGISHLAAGNLEAARAAFGQLVIAGPYNQSKGEEQAGNFLLESARQLAREEPVGPAAGKGIDRVNYQSLALLAYGLQNWQLGKVEDGTAYLREFRRTAPMGDHAWISELKIVAGRVLEEYTAFQMAEEQIKAPTTKPDAKKKALATIRAMKPPLGGRAAALESLVTSTPPATPAPISTPPPPAALAALGEWSQTPLAQPEPWGGATGTPAALNFESGRGDFWLAADVGHFVYQKLEGDGDVVVRIASVEGRDEWAKIGVMLRVSLEPGARRVFGAVSARRGVTHQLRVEENGPTKSEPIPGQPATLAAPRWLKLERRGDLVTTFQSEDGQTWNQMGQATIPGQPKTVFVGLAGCGRGNTMKAVAENLRLEPRS